MTGAALATADVEAALKTYLKTNLTPEALAGRVFYSVPAGTPVLPLVTLAELSVTVQRGEVGVGDHTISFDCWARTKQEASDIKRALVGLMQTIAHTQLDSETYCYGLVDGALSSSWRPDNDAKLARYVVDATLTCVPRGA